MLRICSALFLVAFATPALADDVCLEVSCFGDGTGYAITPVNDCSPPNCPSSTVAEANAVIDAQRQADDECEEFATLEGDCDCFGDPPTVTGTDCWTIDIGGTTFCWTESTASMSGDCGPGSS